MKTVTAGSGWVIVREWGIAVDENNVISELNGVTVVLTNELKYTIFEKNNS